MKTSNTAEILADRVRCMLADRPIVTKRMFGLTFLPNGNMLCCVSEKGLMARVGAAAEHAALVKPYARRTLPWLRETHGGFILVEPAGVASGGDLKGWLSVALAHVEHLPPKKAKPAQRH